MADDGEGRKSSWSSWFTPGDARLAQRSPQQQDSDAKRPTQSLPSHVQDVSQQNEHEPKLLPSPFAPFIAFKHFVDDQLAAVTRFPEDLAVPKQQTQATDVETEEDRTSAHRRWTGMTEPFDDGDDDFPSDFPHGILGVAGTLRALVVEQSAWQNRHVPVEKLVALFEDEISTPDLPPDFGPYHPSNWLSVPWFKYNAYSPINLEADSLLSKYDTKWRSAFEDLLETSLDKPMTSHERYHYHGLIAGTSGMSWMLNLQSRGILPPQVPSWYYPGRTALEFQRCFGQLASYEPVRGQPWMVTSEIAPERFEAAYSEFESLLQGTREAVLDQPNSELDMYERIEQQKDSSDPALADHQMQRLWQEQQFAQEQQRLIRDLEPTAHEQFVMSALYAMMGGGNDNEQLHLARTLDKYHPGGNYERQYLEELDTQWTKAVAAARDERMLQWSRHQAQSDGTDSQLVPEDKDLTQPFSTVTTTQTTRLPDGRVQTSISVKRRFADGREETQESTQTSFDESTYGNDRERAAADKKGWFWS